MCDIKEMIFIITSSGMRQPEIADRTNTTQATISRISRGAIPNYVLGKKIERLYSDVISDHVSKEYDKAS